MLSDHQCSPSGVGMASYHLINGLLATGDYSFRCFGGALKHGNYDVLKISDDFIIKPIDGFGNKELIRVALASEKPDALFLFTDPRFFSHIFDAEDEIHQVCPIVYWTIWDNYPTPVFNKVLYQSCDLLNCISWITYDMIKTMCPEKTNYIPHALPKNTYHQLPDDEQKKFKTMLLGKDREDHFVGMWVGRNAKRKRPNDLLEAWKIFLDKLELKHGHRKATLVLHTDALDQEGPNLFATCEYLGIINNIFFSKHRLELEQMNVLHNISDFGINISLNEGFGIPTLESMQCGKPIIAVKTGGETRQVVDHRDGSHNGIALDIDTKSLVGSQQVYYIYEDYVSAENVSNAILQMYEFGPEKRKALGQKAKEYASYEFNYDKMVADWDRTLKDTISNWKSRYKPWICKEL